VELGHEIPQQFARALVRHRPVVGDQALPWSAEAVRDGRIGKPERTEPPRRTPMTEIRTILFASDLSPESDRAFEHARFLAERFGAQLTIYHALEMPRSEYEGWVDATDDRRARWERQVREELSRRAGALAIPHEVVVQGGLVGGRFLADLAVLDVIHERRPDLTVMATKTREGFASFFLGSVTAQVVQHAGRPVLCVRKAPHDAVLPYQRILVTTDFSPASRRAFPLAALMAQSFGATVTALHVAGAPRLAALTGVPAPPVPRVPSQAELRRFLQPDFEALPVDVRVSATGSPWREIVKTAEEQKTDLIVMSTEGLDSLHDKIIGSNAERVLRHAPCSVLVT
jgi:nucleotide-binding universal stress UspA family protein